MKIKVLDGERDELYISNRSPRWTVAVEFPGAALAVTFMKDATMEETAAALRTLADNIIQHVEQPPKPG